MTSVSRAILWATLAVAVIIGIELTTFFVIASIPSPIPRFFVSMPIIISITTIIIVALQITRVSSTPPATDMRNEYGLPDEYHWPIDER